MTKEQDYAGRLRGWIGHPACPSQSVQDDLKAGADEIERLRNDCQELTSGDRKFVSSDTLRRELTGDPPDGQYAALLKEAERGEAVNTLDLIDALWWRLRNQRREIARLMKERDTARRSLELTQAQQRQAAIEIERLSEGHENIQRINDNGAKEIERLRKRVKDLMDVIDSRDKALGFVDLQTTHEPLPVGAPMPAHPFCIHIGPSHGGITDDGRSWSVCSRCGWQRWDDRLQDASRDASHRAFLEMPEGYSGPVKLSNPGAPVAEVTVYKGAAQKSGEGLVPLKEGPHDEIYQEGVKWLDTL